MRWTARSRSAAGARAARARRPRGAGQGLPRGCVSFAAQDLPTPAARGGVGTGVGVGSAREPVSGGPARHPFTAAPARAGRRAPVVGPAAGCGLALAAAALRGRLSRRWPGAVAAPVVRAGPGRCGSCFLAPPTAERPRCEHTCNSRGVGESRGLYWRMSRRVAASAASAAGARGASLGPGNAAAMLTPPSQQPYAHGAAADATVAGARCRAAANARGLNLCVSNHLWGLHLRAFVWAKHSRCLQGARIRSPACCAVAAVVGPSTFHWRWQRLSR
jgi:hypothetical protein